MTGMTAISALKWGMWRDVYDSETPGARWNYVLWNFLGCGGNEGGEKVRMTRPVHIWWLGVGLFTPSLLIWGCSLGLFIYRGWFDCPPDRHGITHVYLPLFAAVVGFATPFVCLRVLRHASWRVTGWAFTSYLAAMLAWAVIDIRHEHYQMGGHRYPNGPLIDGHRYYWHAYYTWYFIPYRWIEHGIREGENVRGNVSG